MSRRIEAWIAFHEMQAHLERMAYGATVRYGSRPWEHVWGATFRAIARHYYSSHA